MLAQFKSEPNEELSAVVVFTRKEGNKDVPYICAGSVIWPEGDKPVTGKLRIFTPVTLRGKEARGELKPVASQDVVGSVYALKWVNDKLVAAVESAVRMISFQCLFIANSRNCRCSYTNAFQIHQRHPHST